MGKLHAAGKRIFCASRPGVKLVFKLKAITSSTVFVLSSCFSEMSLQRRLSGSHPDAPLTSTRRERTESHPGAQRPLGASVSLPVKNEKWFSDAANAILPGRNVGFEISNIIARRKTAFKDVILFNSKAFGKVLVFDGNTQITEKDGFAYYEMCAHLPLFCHPCPKDILIVGGLDGSWLAREIFKHPTVERITHVEPDFEMVTFLRQYFHAPKFDTQSHPRFQYTDQDPKEFLKGRREQFDVIITDCTAPPPEEDGLFGASYYELVKDALRPDGVTITQSWGIWVELEPPTDVLLDNMRWSRNLFPTVSYYTFSMPSVTSGQAGNIICSKLSDANLAKPARVIDSATVKNWNLNYYNAEIHEASFVLPEFAKKALFPQSDDS